MTTAAHPRHSRTAAPAQGQHPRPDLDEDDRAIQIAAAQLRLVTDRKLGKVTPDWVKELAKEDPAAS